MPRRLSLRARLVTLLTLTIAFSLAGGRTTRGEAGPSDAPPATAAAGTAAGSSSGTPAGTASPAAAVAQAATTGEPATGPTAGGTPRTNASPAAASVSGKAMPFRIEGVVCKTTVRNYYENDGESSRSRKKFDREIVIELSLPVSLDEVRGAITVVPQVALDWKRASQPSTVAISVPGDFSPGQSYRLIVNRLFRDSTDAHWVDPHAPSFTYDYRGSMLEWDGVKDMLERESRQLVHLSVRNADTIRLEAVRVPPVALLPGEPEIISTAQVSTLVKTWAADARRLAEGLSGQPGPFAPMLDGTSDRESEVFSEPGEADKDRHVSLPLEWRHAADDGCSYILSARSTTASQAASTPASAPPRLLQITDLALSCKYSPSQLVVWVTRLGSAAVVPDASLFATTTAGTLVALGRTDEDGLLEIDDGEAKPTLDVTQRAPGISQSAVTLSTVRHLVAFAGLDGHGPRDMVWQDLGAGELPRPPRIAMGWTPHRTTHARSLFQKKRKKSWRRRRHHAGVQDEDTDVTTQGPLSTESSEISTAQAALTRAYVFTERGIYRPGDTVHFKAFVRAFSEGVPRAPQGDPAPTCKVIVHDAKDQEQVAKEFPLNGFGTATGDIPTTKHDAIGAWTLKVQSPDGKVDWGQTTFRVEEFVAPRHKVEITFLEAPEPQTEGAREGEDHSPQQDAARNAGGQASAKAQRPARPGAERWRERSVQAVIRAQYYAGGPVKHGKVRWRATLVESRHAMPEAPGFVCGTDLPGQPDLLESGEATLDASGQLVLDIPLMREIEDGRRALKVFATALDFDARAAASEATYTHTPRYLVGISTHPVHIEPDEPIVLRAIVFDRKTKERVQGGVLNVAYLRETYTEVQKRDETGDTYSSYEELMVPETQTATGIFNGEARIQPSFGRWGDHQLKVEYTAPDGHLYASTTTFIIGNPGGEGDEGEGGYDDSRRDDRWLAHLPADADRTDYAPGDVAHITVMPSRVPANYLVTVERDGIMRTEVHTARPGATTFDVKIEEEDQPNVYVSVLAVYPRDGYPSYATEVDTGMPAVEMGYVTLPVHREHGDLKIAFRGAGEGVTALPRERRKIVVRVTDKDGKPAHAEVALGVVDESVLALTGYKSPALGPLFVQVLPLMVRSSDIRRGLTPQSPYRSFVVRALTGGDGGGKYNLTREWFDPVALFAPSLVTDSAGEVAVEFTVPDTMTQYRVYAVACDAGAHHGAASSSLVARKPFYIDAGVPRCFTDGDRGSFQVSLVNGTDSPQTASVWASDTGGLSFSIDAPSTLVPAHDRVSVPVTFAARALPGHPEGETSTITIRGRMGTLSDAVAQPVPVRSRYVTRRQMARGLVTERPTSMELAVPPEVASLPPQVALLSRAQLSVSDGPFVQLTEALDYVLQYPHGCIEQTSSGVIPLAAMRALLQSKTFPGVSIDAADKFLAAGIDRILTMQTSEGGFAYWPGEHNPHPWGSVYGTLALSMARRAGAKVPEDRMHNALTYIEKFVLGSSLSDQSAGAIREYVLALNGLPVPHLDDDLKIALAWPAGAVAVRETGLLLCLAASAAGKRDVATRLAEKLMGAPDRPWKGGTPFWGERSFDPWSFYSINREWGVACVVLSELLPTHPALSEITVKLLDAMLPRAGWFFSTHECAWGLLGLTDYFRQQKILTRASEVKILEPKMASAQVTLPRTGSTQVDLDGPTLIRSPSVTLALDSPGLAFATVELEYPWRGPDVQPEKAPIRRQYVRLAGEGDIHVGDLVEVTLHLPRMRGSSYLALTDPLPACLVAINSELKTEEQVPRSPGGSYYDGTSTNWTDWDEHYVTEFIPSHLELHDDRVAAFRDEGCSYRSDFKYVARAICEGTFVAPPARLEPMYQPNDSVFSAETVLKVLAAATRGH